MQIVISEVTERLSTGLVRDSSGLGGVFMARPSAISAAKGLRAALERRQRGELMTKEDADRLELLALIFESTEMLERCDG